MTDNTARGRPHSEQRTAPNHAWEFDGKPNSAAGEELKRMRDDYAEIYVDLMKAGGDHNRGVAEGARSAAIEIDYVLATYNL